MIVATAGHIDHGKTTLIRALTGAETDRLPEERARGISIDLGFAYWRPDGGGTIGFVDVPGHEKFVRNMLAGLSGLSFALLVVAADAGVMPQTVEHLRILDLLRIERGLVVLTKCDRAAPERIAEVLEEIAELLADSALAQAPTFEVSAVTGAGLETLKSALIAERDAHAEAADAGRGFRLAIDRVFTVAGAGTVVTGTVVAGQVETGDTLSVLPLGREVRARGLESAGAKVARAVAGQRCAVNLAGIEVGELHRGDWLVDPDLHTPTSRVEARLDSLAALRHDARVRLHIGAAALDARVLTPRQRSLAPGDRSLVQLVFKTPTSAITGDRFVLRDSSGRHLIGGGRVVDPLATPARRPPALRAAVAAALNAPEPAGALKQLAELTNFEPESAWFARCFNLTAMAMRELLNDPDLVVLGKSPEVVLSRARFERLGQALVDRLRDHHAAHPELGGLTRREARNGLGETISAEVFGEVVRDLAVRGRIDAASGLLRLPGHSASFSPAETALWSELVAAFEDRPPRAILVADAARELRTSEAALRAMLYRRRVNGDVWQVTETRFLLREHLVTLVEVAAALDAASDQGFTAAEFRDASGIGRNFVIQLLEFFDRIGVTRRMGETRRMRPDYAAVVGDPELTA